MNRKMPPVPPASRNPKSPRGTAAPDPDTAPEPSGSENTDDRGTHGNIKQNTRNQGYQQDR